MKKNYLQDIDAYVYCKKSFWLKKRMIQNEKDDKLAFSDSKLKKPTGCLGILLMMSFIVLIGGQLI